MFAVDRTSGALLWSVQVDTNPASIITGSPTVYNGVVYVGVSSYDESDSQLCCTFRGAGNNYSVPAGTCQKPHQENCQPPAASDYFDSILALQLSTGTVAWDYHTVTADASNDACKSLCGPDADFASSPT